MYSWLKMCIMGVRSCKNNSLSDRHATWIYVCYAYSRTPVRSHDIKRLYLARFHWLQKSARVWNLASPRPAQLQFIHSSALSMPQLVAGARGATHPSDGRSFPSLSLRSSPCSLLHGHMSKHANPAAHKCRAQKEHVLRGKS